MNSALKSGSIIRPRIITIRQCIFAVDLPKMTNFKFLHIKRIKTFVADGKENADTALQLFLLYSITSYDPTWKLENKLNIYIEVMGFKYYTCEYRRFEINNFSKISNFSIISVQAQPKNRHNIFTVIILIFAEIERNQSNINRMIFYIDSILSE